MNFPIFDLQRNSRCPGAAHFFYKYIHRKGTGNITGFGTAHTVTNNTEQAIPV